MVRRHIEVSNHRRLNALTMTNRGPASMMRPRVWSGSLLPTTASKNNLQFRNEGNGFVQPNVFLPIHVRFLQVRRHRRRHSPQRRHHRARCSLQAPQTHCLHPLSVHMRLRDMVCHGIVCLEWKCWGQRVQREDDTTCLE